MFLFVNLYGNSTGLRITYINTYRSFVSVCLNITILQPQTCIKILHLEKYFQFQFKKMKKILRYQHPVT